MSEPVPDPIVTRAQLAERIKQADSGALDELLAEAVTLVDDRLENAYRPVPVSVYRDIVLRVGFALWEARKSAHGTGQQVTMEGQVPVRSPRDPFTSAQSLINLYVLGFS